LRCGKFPEIGNFLDPRFPLIPLVGRTGILARTAIGRAKKNGRQIKQEIEGLETKGLAFLLKLRSMRSRG
jgi:hypothetical protein